MLYCQFFYMSENIESFSASEQNEGIDSAALEQLRENMRAAKAQMKKDKAQEKKQKKQEDSLLEILFVLIKKLGPTDPRVQLISACLAKNFPAQTILIVLSLEFKSISKHLDMKFLEKNTHLAEAQEKALIIGNLGKSKLPIYIRYNLDLWIKSINKIIFDHPHKNLAALRDTDHGTSGQQALGNILSYIAQDNLQKAKVDFYPQNLINFIEAFVGNLAERLQKQIDTTQQITNNIQSTEE